MGRRPKSLPPQYSWAAGAEHPVPPDVVAAELAIIERRLNRLPTAKDFVEAARNPKSPLHPLLPFDKTDRELAEARLESIAGNVIRSLRVTYTTEPDRVVKLRAQISISTGGRRGFMPVATVLASADYRKQMIADALRDAETFCRKYTDILVAVGEGERAQAIVRTLATLLK
jgi:hypothetical protein